MSECDKIKKWPTVGVLPEIKLIIQHGHTLIYWFLPFMKLTKYIKKKRGKTYINPKFFFFFFFLDVFFEETKAINKWVAEEV